MFFVILISLETLLSGHNAKCSVCEVEGETEKSAISFHNLS